MAAVVATAADSRSANFNRGWKFHLGDVPAAAEAAYSDSLWRSLDLPHDWAIEGDFSADNPSGTGGGALPGGIGWYRKAFEASEDMLAKWVYVDFDGAYMNATVYINGHRLGTRPYGYAPFSYELTPYLHKGSNLLAVRVDNSEQPNSRWYAGCGIYRDVRLRVLGPVHVAQWGTCVVADADGSASITTTVENCAAQPTEARLVATLLAPDGSPLAADTLSVAIAAKGRCDATQRLAIANPMLWSPSSPTLYTVVSEVIVGNAVVDRYTTTTGFRRYEFSADKGFYVNGERMKINGVCLHHDFGALGAAFSRRAAERQLTMMKEMGANAIRCTHNPPAEALLDLCDSLGIMVMDETFDMWRKRKTAHDYSRYFDQWHERDLTDLVVRDRNHPSIFAWSIGNEVLEQWSDARADTLSLAEANLLLNFGHKGEAMLATADSMSVNSMLTVKLADMVRTLDPTRPITAGCNEPDPGNHLFRSGALDIIGFNYHDDWFASVPANFPGKPFVVTESVSALMTRGYYRMPSDSCYIWPERWDKPFYDPSLACSSYDNCHVPWGNTHEGTMRLVSDNDFISGQFVWTGFDYLGEPTPYGWPARSSFFGIVDLAGFPKDIYYMYQSQWRPDLNVLHLFPHWTWPEGTVVDLWCYYNNADEVELYLNGRSLGSKPKDAGGVKSTWRVAYEPGVVEAVSRKGGKEVARTMIATAGTPYALRLTPDRTAIAADGTDLCYVTAEIVDANGTVCPWATDVITFDVAGCGINVGVDNGNPTSLERFKADSHSAMAGKALLIVRSNGTPGKIAITASASNLISNQITITAK